LGNNKIIFESVDFEKKNLFEMPKYNEITMKGKIEKLVSSC
jgi:hypothetical protein